MSRKCCAQENIQQVVHHLSHHLEVKDPLSRLANFDGQVTGNPSHVLSLSSLVSSLIHYPTCSFSSMLAYMLISHLCSVVSLYSEPTV